MRIVHPGHEAVEAELTPCGGGGEFMVKITALGEVLGIGRVEGGEVELPELELLRGGLFTVHILKAAQVELLMMEG